MDLYFAPLACSMATRIALYVAGASARFVQVDLKLKRLHDGSDFLAVNPMGQVPVLRTDEGRLLQENPVVLQYVADRFPAADLAAPSGIERYRLQQWLNFIGTELHKQVFIPQLDRTSPDGAKAFAGGKMGHRFAYLSAQLEGRAFLLDHFTVADAYLTTVLNWASPTGIDLAAWPVVQSYFQRMQHLPSVARALKEELALHRAEQAHRAIA